ncbi:MAG: DUF5107 domain-containing protein [Chloroflexota bacterium]|nr:DUF5107 domain-containing protein [Chloroflexota bacterium]
MSELRIETYSMPAAELGAESPLPPIRTGKELHEVANIDPDVPDEMRRNMAYGHIPYILPYTMQDGYSRQLQDRSFRVAVLENEHLRATFLLELGGRLWSLVHKPSERELLYVNPVFQPANLALRNAWFSGGVEWNIGTIGHSPFTCAPLFAARIESPGGTPVLRMYEYERLRGVPFQIDAYLPDDSPVLFVRVRIMNPHKHEIPMYWWSNIALPETPDTRVIVPADSVYRFNYHKLGVMPLPKHGGIDVTYATNTKSSTDFFYHVPDRQRKWIASLNGDGVGLVQVSTDLLKGRKLFIWGMGAGGRKWQEFLSEPGKPYIEIQAGLARTQMEHLPMPPGDEWSWLEAYGLMEAHPDVVHGDDWRWAQQAVETSLERLIPRAELEAEFERGATFVDTPHIEILHYGSGWGALERLRREAAGEPQLTSDGLVFSTDSLSEAQMPWLNLLYDGAMPHIETDDEPRGYIVQAEWRTLLEDSVQSSRTTNWLAWLHLGVMRYYASDRDGARQAWEQSLKHNVTLWALRNLALQALEEERLDDAVTFYVDAFHLRPDLRPLAVECGRTLIEAGQPEKWLDLLDEMPPSLRADGRIRLLEAQAALHLNDYGTVELILAGELVVNDMREGEVSLSQLWFEFHERRLSKAEGIPADDALRARVLSEYPVPEEFDFRMMVEDRI